MFDAPSNTYEHTFPGEISFLLSKAIKEHGRTHTLETHEHTYICTHTYTPTLTQNQRITNTETKTASKTQHQHQHTSERTNMPCAHTSRSMDVSLHFKGVVRWQLLPAMTVVGMLQSRVTTRMKKETEGYTTCTQYKGGTGTSSCACTRMGTNTSTETRGVNARGHPPCRTSLPVSARGKKKKKSTQQHWLSCFDAAALDQTHPTRDDSPAPTHGRTASSASPRALLRSGTDSRDHAGLWCGALWG